MEEGKLEPEPEPVTASAAPPSCDRNKNKGELIRLVAGHRDAEVESSCREIRRDAEFDGDRKMDEAEGVKKSVEKGDDEAKEVAEPLVSAAIMTDSATANASENETSSDRGASSQSELMDIVDEKGEKDKENRENHEPRSEECVPLVAAKQFHSEEEVKNDKGCNLDVKKEEVGASRCVEEAGQGNERVGEYVNSVSDCSDLEYKDKDRSVVGTPTHFLVSIGDGALAEGESVCLSGKNCNEADDLEGQSIREFELFSSSRIRKLDKCEKPGVDNSKDEDLLLEPLDLSLSLPNVLLPVGGQDANPPPGLPGCSDGFAVSMSFSDSQSFQHNPSCSLNHNTVDNEQSVHSLPIFQGADWQALVHNDSRNKENPVCQKVMRNGNGSIHPHALKSILSSGQAVEGLLRSAEGSCKGANGLERQLTFQKGIDACSPCANIGSYENGPNYSFGKEKAKEMLGDSMSWINSLKFTGDDFVETVIWRSLSEMMHVTARRFHDMPACYLSSLKEGIRQMMLNMDKRVQLCAFQDALNRADLTLEMLQKLHRAHLEILVALKTGCPAFLRLANGIHLSELAEIFMKLRCKNLTYRSLVPVDECDCNICARKEGFCSACMCLVCSNFDMASNTCSWVGCDVCLHWCHTDCGLRESHLRNGNSASGAQGTTEMQFHCVACDHPSEMFGFVKEVFQNFAREWRFERFCKELEYIKRIFSASKDLRGRRIHEVAYLMLERLANKSIDVSEACNHIVVFLSDCGSSNLGEGPVSFRKEHSKARQETAGPSEDDLWRRYVYSENPPKPGRPAIEVKAFQRARQSEMRAVEKDYRRSPQKEPVVFEELESIVRIKQAEAEMFQGHADDARREAEGLKRIAVAKNEKIEEEYRSRIGKLSLAEAEELRRKKYEELQALERAHRDYFDMKMRMEDGGWNHTYSLENGSDKAESCLVIHSFPGSHSEF